MSATGGRNQNADQSSAFFANNDASSYNTRYLKSIRNKERFQELHFYQCTIGLIDELFPKQGQKGQLDPPATYRASAITLAQWRELSQEEQLSVLEKETKQQQQQQTTTTTTQGGDPVASSAAPASATSAAPASGELKRSLDAIQQQGEQPSAAAAAAAAVPAPPAAKVLKTDEVEVARCIPDRWEATATNLDIDFCKDRICRGISLDFLRKSYPTEGAKIEGFAPLVGDAMQYKAQTYKNGQSWPFACDPRILGAIVEEQVENAGTESEKAVIQLKWVCRAADIGSGTNIAKLETIQFHHPSCITNSTTLLCENCKANCIDLVSLCGASVVSN